MLKIKWLGQGGYLLWDEKTAVCIDPYLSDLVERIAGRPRAVAPCVTPEELTADVIVCTHDHADHLDSDAIPRMPKGALFLAPRAAEEKLRSLGVGQFAPFDEGAAYRVGDFALTAMYAKHTVPAVGVLIRHRDVTLYITGDTYYDERLTEARAQGVDILCVCINGRLGNMNVEEAVRLTEAICPRVGIPMHYGMFASNTEDPTKYTARLACGYEMVYGQEYEIDEVNKCLV